MASFALLALLFVGSANIDRSIHPAMPPVTMEPNLAKTFLVGKNRFVGKQIRVMMTLKKMSRAGRIFGRVSYL